MPADINYPNDLGLLNQARVKTEKIIDILYEPLKIQLNKKPKTYRNLARKEYLKVAKKRKPSRIDDRIVSLSQPHIRPIVRGKAGTPVEFGAKLSASVRDGYVFLDRISWDNFNESGDFKAQIEAFKEATGVYPESVHVDKIYRTRSNRAFCKEKGIRISGPPLGRPPAQVSLQKKKQALEDEKIRNAIEGKFGISKRRFSMNRVMRQLPHTSQTAIAITFLVMNLSTLLRQFFCLFLCNTLSLHLFLSTTINSAYTCGIINNKSS